MYRWYDFGVVMVDHVIHHLVSLFVISTLSCAYLFFISRNKLSFFQLIPKSSVLFEHRVCLIQSFKMRLTRKSRKALIKVLNCRLLFQAINILAAVLLISNVIIPQIYGFICNFVTKYSFKCEFDIKTGDLDPPYGLVGRERFNFVYSTSCTQRKPLEP